MNLCAKIPHRSAGFLTTTRLSTKLGGDGEIRTLDTLLRYTRFPIVRARPATRHLHIAVSSRQRLLYPLSPPKSIENSRIFEEFSITLLPPRRDGPLGGPSRRGFRPCKAVSALVGGELQPDKVALLMGADRALGGRLLAGHNMAAVKADPAGLHVADKQLVLPHQLGKALKALGVHLLDLCDLAEVPGDLRKPDRKSVV